MACNYRTPRGLEALQVYYWALDLAIGVVRDAACRSHLASHPIGLLDWGERKWRICVGRQCNDRLR